MNIGDVGFNWFDLVVLGVLGVGVYRGRSRGMSEELLDVLQWLVIVVVAGFVYKPVGKFVADYTHFSLLASYISTYIAVIVVCRLLFGWFKRMVGEKLVGSDVFGRWEYYLGMGAGAVRFACYLIVGMALLNAKHITPEQLAAQSRLQQENFGDISFPTLGSIQQTVLHRSASGQFVKKHLAHELIVTGPSERSSARANTIGRQRESAVYEVLGERR